MALSYDRLTRAIYAVVKSAFPRIDYLGLYRAVVVVQSSQDAKKNDMALLDVIPDDPRLPSMGGIPLRLGLPGARVEVKSGTHVLIGWSAGDPSQPYATLWDVNDPAVSITINAEKIFLGGKPVAEGGTLIEQTDGFVHGRGIDAFTGKPFFALGSTSKKVIGGKD
jgi:hypothetical protein